MKKISRRSFLHAAGVLATTVLGTGLMGCGNGSKASAKEHEPLHILTAGRDYTDFLTLLHNKYPEINVQLDAYYGQNKSAYMHRQLTTGILPDIYTSTYFWSPDKQRDYLIDLSKYPITDRYLAAEMKETDVDGSTYLLPYDFTIDGIGCNRSLLARNNLKIPSSFEEMKELLPKVRAADITPSICQINLPGLGFQYFCNISDTVFLNTLEGREWQHNFLKNQVNASNVLQGCADYVQEWIDCGLLNMDYPNDEINITADLFHRGNAAFFVGQMSTFAQNDDGSGDQYSLLPYLSPDGSNNTYIMKVTRYYGLSKELEKPGNEQKLEDALHFLEVLSTVEGFESITGSMPTVMCSLTDFSLPETSPYYKALTKVNIGHTAPYLYAGWENYTADFGEAVRRWVNGEISGTDALKTLDQLQLDIIRNGGVETYGTVTETLNTLQTAQLIGKIFLEAAGADAALISCNETKEGVNAFHENGSGVSGCLLPGRLAEEDIVAVLPTGWYGTIYTATFSGARLKELAEQGFDQNGTGDTYPYAFVTKNSAELQNDQIYTVVLCGATADVWDEGSFTDTGIVGLDAAKAYFQRIGEISASLLE